MKRGLVVDCDFLAWPNVAQSNKQDVAVENLHEGAGFARMINVMRAITAAAAVKTPAIIDGADAQPPPPRPAISFGVSNFFASVLCYFPAAFEVSN